MIRAKSALPRTRPVEVQILDEQLHHQMKKANLLDADRTDFWRHAEDLKEKNKQEIQRLKIENIKLKQLRDQLSGVKKQRRSSAQPTETVDENYWRRQFDKEKHSTASKKNTLMNLQGILEDLEDNKMGMTEESPLVKNIRVLENRLDKVMIKYNEAQSIRKTYEQISKRLKEERTKYDNQLATIQKTLKGKSHDYQQLLLLAHDATHAKETAQAELKKFENKKQSIDELRGKFLKEKRSQLELKKFIPRNQAAKQNKAQQKPTNTDMLTTKGESNFQKQQLADYQDAYRKLKEVTGVLDANQIIQKFKTQDLTTSQFERQKDEYQEKINELRAQYTKMKSKLDKLKFKEEKEVMTSPQSYLNQIQRLEFSINEVKNAHEKMKVKEERLQKIMLNVKAGTKHISSSLDFYKIQHYSQTQPQQQSMLKVITNKIQKIHRVIVNDPDYNPKDLKQTSSKLEQYFQTHSHLNEVMKNVRLQHQKDDSQSEDELEESFRMEEKLRKMDYNKIKK